MARWGSWAVLAGAVALAAALVSCGGGGSSTPGFGTGDGGGGGGGVGGSTVVSFAVVADSGANTVPVLGIAANGGLAPVTGSPFFAGANPSRVAVAPNGKWIYIANFGSLSQFAISTTGAMTPLDLAVPATVNAPGGIVVDPSGKFVLVANQAAQSVSAFAINQASGALPAIATSVTSVNVSPVSIAVSGRFVYLGGEDKIDGYVLDTTTGTLTPMPGTPFLVSNLPTAITSLTVAPSGAFLYVTSSTTPEIHVFNLNATTGVPTTQGGAAVSGTDPTFTAMNPAGTLLFAASPVNNKVTTFFVDAVTGSFGSTLPVNTAVIAPTWIAYDPVTNFLLVLHNTNKLSVFSVNTTSGALTAVASSPVAVGTAPAAFAIAKP